jgi:hypothetical protein
MPFSDVSARRPVGTAEMRMNQGIKNRTSAGKLGILLFALAAVLTFATAVRAQPYDTAVMPPVEKIDQTRCKSPASPRRDFLLRKNR